MKWKYTYIALRHILSQAQNVSKQFNNILKVLKKLRFSQPWLFFRARERERWLTFVKFPWERKRRDANWLTLLLFRPSIFTLLSYNSSDKKKELFSLNFCLLTPHDGRSVWKNKEFHSHPQYIYRVSKEHPLLTACLFRIFEEIVPPGMAQETCTKQRLHLQKKEKCNGLKNTRCNLVIASKTGFLF